MAYCVNVYVAMGRLTRDPVYRAFDGGGGVVNFGFATEGDRKQNDAGQWEAEPVFLDCKAFDGKAAGGRKLASLVRDRCRKGDLVHLQGKLLFEKWDKDGHQQSRIVFKVEDVVLMPNKRDETAPVTGGATPQRQAAGRGSPPKQAAQTSRPADDGEAYPDEPGYRRRPGGQAESQAEAVEPSEDDIPF